MMSIRARSAIVVPQMSPDNRNNEECLQCSTASRVGFVIWHLMDIFSLVQGEPDRDESAIQGGG